MKLSIMLVCMVALAAACHQTSSPSEQANQAISDLVIENVKGQVVQLETDIYLVDSASGKMGKLESKSIEIYSNGYDTSYSYYTASDSSTTVSVYGHNANGYTTSMTTTKKGKPVSSMQLVVDSAGHYTLATSFDSTGKMDTYYDSILSNNYRQVIAAKGHHVDSTLKMTFTNTYDSVYYTGAESKDSVGKLTYLSVIKLNDNNEPMQMDETVVTKDSTKKTITTYTYDGWDKQGNWTQQTAFEKGIPKKMMRRIITYKP